MLMHKFIRIAAVCLAFALPALNAVGAEQWHFKVTNKTASNITNLQVSEDKSSWGNFDIGSGIGPGATETLVWDSSTNNQACDQWIRAKFADGSLSEASKENFCKDLDTPIEFSE
jgi:hypothetical protein